MLVFGAFVLRAARAGVKLAQAVVAQRGPPVRDGASREAAQLRERFEEAMATLRKTQSGGRSLYELPWYVIIGPPGSGKTTALVNSGLKFPLAQRFGKEALRGVGGTRNCDWWFTDEAVLLDTAGRYTTQDSDESSDSAGWAEFLNLLVKYRKRRPLNGVIVTLSAADLMTHTPAERETNVETVRRRLDELNRQLRLRLPVYLLVTKCDLISGFGEYFDDLDAAGRSQVWGMTFAPERGATGAAAEDFAGEFDALIERLNQRLFGRIDAEHDTRRRTATFAFPQQMAGLRNLIGRFLTEVFAATRFDGRLLLRGVYFTSGTQEGTPIDRLMAAIGRGFQVAPAAVVPSMGRGKAYFIETLLRDVLFAEAGLAGLNRRRELQLAALQLSAYASLILVAVLGVLAFSVSYRNNESYLADVSQALDRYSGVAPANSVHDLPQVLPALDALLEVTNVAERFAGHLAWTMRAGLFQGGAIGDEARDAYQRALDDSLLPNIAVGLEQRLQSSVTQPDKLYQYLKAYLMLGEPEHLDKPLLEFLVNLTWQDSFAAQPEILPRLTTHLHRLLEARERLRPLPLDDALVAQTRNTVRQTSLPRLMYDQLKLNHIDDTGHDLRLDIAAGIGVERVLVRKSGKKLSDPVPGLYTRAVFDQISTLGTRLVEQFSQDQWVMGDSSLDVPGSARMASQVMDLYADEYIQTWDGIVNDIQVVPLKSLAQTQDVLGLLGNPATSPLRGFLSTVDANTDFAKPAPGAPVAPTATSAVSAAEKTVMDQVTKVFKSGKTAAAGVSPADRITAHFASINQLVAGPPGGAPIDRVLSQIGQIQQKLSSAGPDVGDSSLMDVLVKSGQGEALKALKLEASTLPPPVGNLIAEVGGRSESLAVNQARGELEQQYQEKVQKPCREIAAGRYPFMAVSGVDVPPADFGRLFGAGGIFDAFFKDRLTPLVDTSRTPWVWRPGGGGPAGETTSMLQQFELAQQIRDNYFGPSGQMPEQTFTLVTGDLDKSATRFKLELDGQALEYRFGPPVSQQVHWPGPVPGNAAVTFEDASGARPYLAFQGPWAWFRLLDAASAHAESDVKIDVQFQTGGHQASIIIEAASIRNAFQKSLLRQFRCGAA